MASDPVFGWYVVACTPGSEATVASAIFHGADAAGLRASVGETQWCSMTVGLGFVPGYVLVHAVMTAPVRQFVLGTPGVSRIITFSARTPLTHDQAVAYVTKKPAAPRPRLPYAEGDGVRVVNGSFSNMTGVVASLDWDHAQVTVTIKIFDRPTPIVLGFADVEKIPY